MIRIMLVTIFTGCFVLSVLGCSGKGVNVSGQLPVAPIHTYGQPITGSGYVYGNRFRVQSSSVYEDLLDACRRCGTKRIINHPFGGGTTYERYWTINSADLKICKNWSSEGYIQIEFAERSLPTKATVLIQPKYTGAQSPFPWGQPFQITTTAIAINKSKGFQILLTPSSGLGGLQTLDIYSDYTNHVNQSELNITVTYGQQNAAPSVISEKLQRLIEKAVKTSPFSCDTYTN